MVKKSGKIRKLKRGVREVVKALRKDVKGIVIFAGKTKPASLHTESHVCLIIHYTHSVAGLFTII